MNIWDIFDRSDFDATVDRKHVKVVSHPTMPYDLFTYTDSCTWENGWNDVSLNSRGMIVHRDTGEIIARPFSKFFNHGQDGAPVFDPDMPLVVMDKADGSLAISYLSPDGDFLLATRGSFTSDQANWANEFYNLNHKGKWSPVKGVTYLFEIIYPENRIVLDYGDTEALVMLGAVDIETGKSIHVHDAAADSGWVWDTVEVFPHATLREILNMPNRENAEGFVLWNPDTDERVKVKQDDYVLLHKYLTNTTEKHVWEVLSSGMNPDEVFAGSPDEFQIWLKNVIADLEGKFHEVKVKAENEYKEILVSLPEGWGRGDFAAKAKQANFPNLMFLMLDERDVSEPIWRSLKPSGVSRTVRRVNPDAD